MLRPMPARVAILAPFGPSSPRGNAVTVARIALALERSGVELSVWDLSTRDDASIAVEIAAYAPALIHAFHAYRTGPLAMRLALGNQVPFVVTCTGTDANHDLDDPSRAEVVRKVLEGAGRVTVFDSSIADRILTVLPALRERLTVVPQSVDLPTSETFDLAARWPLPGGRVLFVFPAGIRGVKNPALPLAPLGRLVRTLPEIRLLYVGPVLDPGVGERLERALAALPWARHIGAVPHTQMGSLLSQADVVVNCSISEGGMANSVLEALWLGRAVLASDIAGNRSLIDHDKTGLLFRDETEFEQGAAALVRDPALRRRLGQAGRELVLRQYPPRQEVEGYKEVYRGLIDGQVRASLSE
jgi:glycosyltransferase involved in cell wall biosynthesis